MSYYYECLQQFNELPKELKDQLGGFAALKVLDEIEKEYSADLKFMVVLIAIGELKVADISEYLQKKFGLEPAKSLAIKNKLNQELFFKLIEEEQGATDEELLKKLKNILASGLTAIFTGKDNGRLELNYWLKYFLIDGDGLTNEEALKILSGNQEVLSKNNLTLDGKEVAGTIASWLVYLQRLGLLSSDERALKGTLEFYNQSVTYKKMEPAEQKSVTMLIELYRNLKGAPDCFLDLPFDEWLFVSYQNDWEVGPADDLPMVDVSAPVQPAAATDKFEQINKLLKSAGDGLEEKYQISQTAAAYANLDRVALVNELKLANNNPAKILALLTVLNKQSSQSDILKDLPPLRDFLLNSGLTENEAAIFIMRLGQTNKQLAALAYVDLKTMSLKLK